jgi:tRNA G10  N-methylase Trm11
MYPYKAKFHPQMVRALLNIMKIKKGSKILDPFIGSGTTAVESQLLGINCSGFDASPLCVLQGNVKTHAYRSFDTINKLVPEAKESINKDPIARGYSDTLTTIISKPKKKFKTFLRETKKEKGQQVYSFFKLAELIAVSDRERRNRNFVNSFNKNIDLMLKSIKMQKQVMERLKIRKTDITIRSGDARKLALDDDTIDAILTSPPYSLAINYVENDKHTLKFMGFNINELKGRYIGVGAWSEDAIKSYNNDMTKSIDEMYRVLKPNTKCAIVIGDAKWKKQPVESSKFIKMHAKKIGFKLLREIPKIIFGRFNSMKHEYILIFKKTEK